MWSGRGLGLRLSSMLFLVMTVFPTITGADEPERPAVDPADQVFVMNVIGPEILLPLDRRGLIRLSWPRYKRTSRFEFKPFERPIYRIFIAPESLPVMRGRIHVTYDTSYPFTNLEAGKRYRVMVDVEQNGKIVLPETVIEAESLRKRVTYYAAPRAEGGSGKNPGTYDRPVDVPFVNANAGPGDMVILKSGTYFSPAEGRDSKKHDEKIHPRRSGRPGKHILFLAESNDVSVENHVSFRTAWGVLSVNETDYVVIEGMTCDSDQGKNSKALASILGEDGHRPFGVIVRNLFFRSPTSDKQLMMNGSRELIVENCFFPGSLESHNVYLCNNTQGRVNYTDSRAIFRNNIAMNATRNNVHANGFFDNFIIENNLMVGAKVANISLATVHRNSHVRNNVTFSGAKQAVTLNFYHGYVPLEDKVPSSNIHICHNTFVVPSHAKYVFAAILISDTRRLFRHVIDGLYIKNNILASEKRDANNMLLNLVQSRHLTHMDVAGNVFAMEGARADQGMIHLPSRSSNERIILPVTQLEMLSSRNGTLHCMDSFRDEKDRTRLTDVELDPGSWEQNKTVDTVKAVFVNSSNRDFRLASSSPARGTGITDKDTCRILRDFAGNPRHHGGAGQDAGAFVFGSAINPVRRLGEYRLIPAGGGVDKTAIPGITARCASVKLEIRSERPVVLRSLAVAMEIVKADPNHVIDPMKDILVEVKAGTVRKRASFYRKDKAGNEKLWLQGWVGDLKVRGKQGDMLPIEVFLTVKRRGVIRRIVTTLAHDNLWGFDDRGLKLAVTGVNEIGFGILVNDG